MAKRSFAEFAAESDSNLTVITADGGRIPAHYDVSDVSLNLVHLSPRASLDGPRIGRVQHSSSRHCTLCSAVTACIPSALKQGGCVAATSSRIQSWGVQ
jgi:hypothetical protein